MDYEKEIPVGEIPVGAFDSELMHQEIFIPEGFEATIDGDKIILTRKESKDEKVRKAIIELVKQSSEILDMQNQSNMLAWLEKQEGCEYIKKDWLEHIKQSWYKEGFIDGKYSGGTSKEWTINDAAIFKEIIDFLENGTAKLQHDLIKYANWLKIQFTPIEKQGRQFSVDKLEPKFKVGDWVVDNCGYVWKIEGILNQLYILEGVEGGESRPTIEWVNKAFHLWTIQDAKDEDVLASDNSIFIFSQEYIVGKPEAYCGIMNGLFIAKSEGCWTNEECYPATKSQRDTLFAKMKEEGYEWDAEKKELKTVEKKPQRVVSAEAKEALYDKPTDNDMQEALRTEYEKGRADVLRCIDPDEMVADFCSQTLSKTRSLASIYRQGIIDILKRINRNEETSITGTRSIDDGGVRPTTNCK